MFGVNGSNIIICGHYGSGKTTFAVNFAMACAGNGEFSGKVHIADLDIVNPYFRTADSAELLINSGVDALIPQFANSNVDIPSLPPRIPELIENREELLMIDVGGDDGSVALGMYDELLNRNGYDMLCCVNMFRPLIADPSDALDCMREIEKASGLKCTGIVNCSSLGRETTADEIADSVEYAEKCAEICGLPLVCTAYIPSVSPETEKVFAERGIKCPLFPMEFVTRQLF